MNGDLIAIIEYWEREKGIDRQTLISAVEESLLAAAKKAVGPARQLRVQIDPKSGDIKAIARLIVVDRVQNKNAQISLAEAQKIKPGVQIGEEIDVEVTPKEFGRIASQYAKQYLLQRIRREEKKLIYEEFKDRVGEIVSGIVKRFEHKDVIVDLGRYEALLPASERVPTEDYQPNDRIRCYVKAVEMRPHGPEIILSRADPQFVVKLFESEVAEIADKTVEIKAIAREPGQRTKVAVVSHDPHVDALGACVGLKGQRVKNIVRELNNEKVDVIEWSPDIVQFVINALGKVTVKGVQLDEARRRVKVIVPPEKLSVAIGKHGQNARLASKLTGWQIEIEPEIVHTKGFEEKIAEAIEALASIPGITREQADALVHAGITKLEELLQAEESDLAEIPGIGDKAAEILAAARAEAQRRTIHIGESAGQQGAQQAQ